MSRPTRPSERTKVFQRSIQILRRVGDNDRIVVGRLREWTAGLSGSGGPSSKGTVSDPTGNAALAVDEHGALRARYNRAITDLWLAVRQLDSIEREVMKPALTHAEAQQRQENQRVGALQPCANLHGCPDDEWATKAGRCEACYRYRVRRGSDRRVSGRRRGTNE